MMRIMYLYIKFNVLTIICLGKPVRYTVVCMANLWLIFLISHFCVEFEGRLDLNALERLRLLVRLCLSDVYITTT